MGGELLSDPSEESKKMSMSEIFWEAYPAYLTMGMSSDEYWNGDARACRAYRKAREEDERRRDIDAYRIGAYIYNALICVAPYFSIKPQKPEPFIKPFSYMQDEELRREEENRQINRATAAFQVWADRFNESRKQNGNST